MKESLEILKHDANFLCSDLDKSFFQNKKILITGVSGLIGINVLTTLVQLIDDGIKIEIWGQYFSEPRDIFKEFQRKSVHFVQMDVSDLKSLEGLPDFDIVIHSAGYGQPGKFLEQRLKTYQIGAMATKTLLDRTKKEGTFIFLSSVEVFHGATEMPLVEDMVGTTSPDHPRACYIEGKRAGEMLCHIYREFNQINAFSVRLGYSYGPGVRKDDQRALYEFIQKAKVQNKIALRDQGKAQRTYCYIRDVLWYLFKMMNEKTAYGVYNLGGISQVSIRGIAELVAKKFDCPLIIPDSEDNSLAAPKEIELSSERIQKEFGKPEFVSIEEGIKRSVDWINSL